MGIFWKTITRRVPAQPRVKRLDPSVLRRIVLFAESVELPKRPVRIRVKLLDLTKKQTGGKMGSAPYYLLVYSDGQEHGCLNAGFAAGQTASYLRFMGLAAVVPYSLPGWVHQDKIVDSLTAEMEDGSSDQGTVRDLDRDMVCRAVIAFGHTLSGAFGRKQQEPAERPCVYRDFRDKWADEVLKYTKGRFPMRMAAIRIECREDRICLMKKAGGSRKTAVSELEAGIAAANIMTAAEELWMELAVVDTGEKRCLISICRSRDLPGIEKAAQETALKQAAARKAISY